MYILYSMLLRSQWIQINQWDMQCTFRQTRNSLPHITPFWMHGRFASVIYDQIDPFPKINGLSDVNLGERLMGQTCTSRHAGSLCQKPIPSIFSSCSGNVVSISSWPQLGYCPKAQISKLKIFSFSFLCMEYMFLGLKVSQRHLCSLIFQYFMQ
jgi:hypothetical protein